MVFAFLKFQKVQKKEESKGRKEKIPKEQNKDFVCFQRLADAGLWSLDEDTQADLIKLSPYAIRAQGVNGKLGDIKWKSTVKRLSGLMQLGRAILHMAKHRGAGFVEMHKVELELEKTNEDEEDGKRKEGKRNPQSMPG